MRLTRVAAAATSLLLLGASSTVGFASAATTGLGTSKASTTVLDVALGNSGSLLHVRVLGDDSRSTTDKKTAAAPEAFSKLTAASATSAVMNNPVTSKPLDLTIDALESRQPGGQAEINQSTVDLAAPGLGVPVGVGNIISGKLNLAKLTSAVDTNGARASLTESLTGLGVAGGLLNANAVSSTSGADSATTSATGTRSAKVDAITVLDLGAILDGLDITL
ncbi:MAG TPA: hypothetical protein VGO92_02085, partial [Acidimicrobiales bacterium]|nr:hypothetical protein [Acidimicrobiales bacterium]